ncbi:MAG: phenylacetate-CoA oxygenase subunit PaaC, partial [Candidatus Competibacteraceae bacterium]|nr:phenylacetate-CoA oxygenase subunit PaaC [Candidatus Competibacteraceae bacterium]
MKQVSDIAPADAQALFEYLLRLGDNDLILGHRLSEWCGHAPVLEEELALSNIALDLIGQAQLWLELAGEIEARFQDSGRNADQLAYRRDVAEFRNLLLVEQPNGNFADTMARQFYFDLWHYLLLEQLSTSHESRIAAIAGKSVKEVRYHLERSSDWVIRLGDGTELSHQRMQQALDEF